MTRVLDTAKGLTVPVLPDLPTPTVLALLALVIVMVVSEPVLGRRQYAEFRADVAVRGEAARVRHYVRWIRHGWVWAAIAVGAVVALPGTSLTHLGLRAPDLAGLVEGRDLTVTPSTIVGMVVGIALAAGVVTLVIRSTVRRGGENAVPLGGATAVLPMLPTTRRGRWGWAGLSVTAGVTEEITFRGLLVLALVALAPGISTPAVVVTCAVLFGIAHWYQGLSGVVGTGLAGAALTMLYLATGSLVLPMVLHTLIDLRALALTPPTAAPDREPAGRTKEPVTP